jgi:hypothetical protein
MYNADIIGQYLVQSLDYMIHYHYHTTTTVPKYNLLHTSQASYEEGGGGEILPVLQMLFNQHTLILPVRKIKLQHKLSDWKCVKLWTTNIDRVFSYEEGIHIDLPSKMHLIPAHQILNY